MGRVAGKVAFITGAGRGQGRSHAVRLAEEGADVIVTDICADLPSSLAPHATQEDLDETARLVEKAGGRVVAHKADVRSRVELDNAVAAGLEAFGKIDIVVANAVSIDYIGMLDLSVEQFQATLDVNLNGVRNTVKAALPSMVGRHEGGSIIFISSGVAYKATPVADYSAAKTALIGFARALANELAGDWIRVNTIHPGHVLTPVVDNEAYSRRVSNMFNDGVPFESRQAFLDFMWDKYKPRHMLPLGWLDPVDISNAVLWLASDESRYVTAEELRVDGGYAERG